MKYSKLPKFNHKNKFYQAKSFVRDSINFCFDNRKIYGDLFRIRFFHIWLYIVSDVAIIKHVLQTNQKNYRKSPAYNQLKLALGEGLITSAGDFWRKQRRMAQPGFYKSALVDIYETMRTQTDLYCDTLRAKSEQEVDLSLEMMTATANIIMQTLFSSQNTKNLALLHQLMHEAQEYIIDRISQPHKIPWYYINGKHRQFKKNKRIYTQLINEFISDRRTNNIKKHDLLSMLMMAKDENGQGMSDQQLRDECTTLFSAGHETSANALLWTFYELLKNPLAFDQLKQEVRSTLKGNIPTMETLRKLPYTLKVIKEGMRLYPPAHAIGRQAIEAEEVMGHQVPKNSIMYLSFYNIHRHPDIWEHPDTFDPSRFDEEKEMKRDRSAYLPFGAGPRMCIGNHFAYMEMHLLLAVLVDRFDFELIPNQTIELDPLITLRSKHPIKVRVTNVT